MNNLYYLECPCASFPRSFARDYKETYLYPPPSTIYGFLLSLVGEEDLTAHLGVQIAIGLISKTEVISRILRKQRSHKFAKKHLKTYSTATFSKPNFQEILTDLKIVVSLNSEHEKNDFNLTKRVTIALSEPETISRFGGLSLGESWAMINGIREYRQDDGNITWLVKDNRGLIGLPIWIDRSSNQGTFQRFSTTNDDFDDRCWVQIKMPQATAKSKSRRK